MTPPEIIDGASADKNLETPLSKGAEESKNHTFRKRRLSLPLHHLSAEDVPAAQSVSAASATAAESADKTKPYVASPNDETEKLACGESSPCKSSSIYDEEGKAHTFRKRRLSLTATTILQDPESAPSDLVRTRRGSTDSMASSVCSKDRKFVSRTLHSGELVGSGVPPPSPAGPKSSSNLLYQPTPHRPPPLLEVVTAPMPDQQHVPRWKLRQTLNPETELHKLPFSRDVVGTYSCHGVEPVYGSEYDEEPAEKDSSPPMVVHASFGSDAPGHSGLDSDDSKLTLAAADPSEEAPPITVAKINQDRGGVAFPYGNCLKTALFAVYDGHGQGGEHISQFALHEIQQRLEKQKCFPLNLEKAMKETFLAVDSALRHEPLIDPLFAGTTACVALLQDRMLTLANAGDSRAVCARKLSNGSYLALELTADQNPDVPAEMERILNAGGYVTIPPEPGLSARVWLDPHCTQIGLAMARSIGDHAVATVGVIADPVVTTHEVTEDDDFLILASDGVWEFLDSLDAVNIVGRNLQRGATKACQALIEAAAARWHEEEGAYRDDITAIVVRLQNLW